MPYTLYVADFEDYRVLYSITFQSFTFLWIFGLYVVTY